MGRIIAVSSGKGGVGKTTLVANLSAALAQYGKSVIAVDGNLTTSNLGLHLGIPLYPKTLQDVLRGKVKINEAIYHHHAGFKVLPADLSVKKILIPKKNELMDILYNLADKVDFIIIDSAAGLGREAKAAIEAADEVITITNPEMPALIDALKLGKIADKFGTRNLGVVINRIRNEKHEVSDDEIRDFLGLPIIGKIEEDHHVRVSVAKKIPVVLHKPNSKASKQIKAIAARLIGESYSETSSFISKLFGWLR